jgi:hypothetical protein
VITLLAGRGVMLVGIDTPSVDPETSKALPANFLDDGQRLWLIDWE